MQVSDRRNRYYKSAGSLARKSVLLAMTALVTFVTGCAAPGALPPKPEEMGADIVAAEGLNPDYSGRPSPVVVRLFQLRSAGAFQSADFFALYSNAEAALAADLVASEELSVQPGQSRQFEVEFDPQTRWVGVLAAFRNIENARWRAVAEMPEDKLIDIISKNRLLIELEPLSVSVSVGKPR